MTKNDEKLNVAAAAFLQALLAENRSMRKKLDELEAKFDEMETTVIDTAIQVEVLAGILMKTIRYARNGNPDDFEQIVCALKMSIPSPEERFRFPDAQGMDFWIMLADEAKTVFPDDSYFQTYEPSDSKP